MGSGLGKINLLSFFIFRGYLDLFKKDIVGKKNNMNFNTIMQATTEGRDHDNFIFFKRTLQLALSKAYLDCANNNSQFVYKIEFHIRLILLSISVLHI